VTVIVAAAEDLVQFPRGEERARCGLGEVVEGMASAHDGHSLVRVHDSNHILHALRLGEESVVKFDERKVNSWAQACPRLLVHRRGAQSAPRSTNST